MLCAKGGTCKDGHDLGAPGLHLHDHGSVMTFITGHNVAPLQNNPDNRGIGVLQSVIGVTPGVVPIRYSLMSSYI